MGLYPIDCVQCKTPFMWFSGTMDQRCDKCRGEKVMTLKDHVQGKVTFQFYRQGNLYYKTETGIVFPVPIEDTGEATFLNEDKAMLFMRYIRKHLDSISSGAV